MHMHVHHHHACTHHKCVPFLIHILPPSQIKDNICEDLILSKIINLDMLSNHHKGCLFFRQRKYTQKEKMSRWAHCAVASLVLNHFWVSKLFEKEDTSAKSVMLTIWNLGWRWDLAMRAVKKGLPAARGVVASQSSPDPEAGGGGGGGNSSSSSQGSTFGLMMGLAFSLVGSVSSSIWQDQSAIHCKQNREIDCPSKMCKEFSELLQQTWQNYVLQNYFCSCHDENLLQCARICNIGTEEQDSCAQ